MKVLRLLVSAATLLLAVTGLTALGAPAQAAGLPAIGSFAVVSQVDHAAKVVWTAPATTRAVKRYRVAWADRAVVLAPAARSYVVPGLSNGVAVTVRIRPVYGPGVWGERRTVQAMGAARPGTPGAPTVARVETAGGRTTVAVSWSPVAANGPAPVQYRVHRTSAAGSTVVCDWTTATSCSNSVVTDGALHTFQVRARNAEATSVRAAGHRIDYISPLGAGSSIVAEAPAPTPTIAAAKGASCGPGVDTTCAGATVACSSTCWYITATAANFAASATCRAFLPDGTPFGATWTQANGTHTTSSWAGPGTTFYLACGNGARSGTYTF